MAPNDSGVAKSVCDSLLNSRRAFDAPGGNFGVLPANGIFDFGHRELIRRELAAIKPNAHRRLAFAKDAHICRAGQRGQARADVGCSIVREFPAACACRLQKR